MPKPLMASLHCHGPQQRAIQVTSRCLRRTVAHQLDGPLLRTMTIEGLDTKTSRLENIARGEFCERTRAVVHRELLGRVHLAEGQRFAVGDKDWIVAETIGAARREGQVTVHF